MKNAVVVTILLGALALSTEAVSQDDAYFDQLPQLVDRELFFGDPEISRAQLSPDGEFVSFMKPYRGVRNIWVKRINEPFDAAQPISASMRPVPGYFWSQDGKYVLYVQDTGGNEDFHVYAVDPSAGAETDTGVPPSRDVTDYDNTRALIYHVPENTPSEILVGLNDRDPALHDVYRVDLETGARELLFRNDANVAGWMFDLEGNLRLARRMDELGNTELLRVDGEELTPVYTCGNEETCNPIRYHKDNRRVYLVTNKGDDIDLTRLVLFDPQTGDEQFIESDPENEVDFGRAEFSDLTEDLVATYYVGDRQRIYPKTDTVAHDIEVLRDRFPEGEIFRGSRTETERLALVNVTSDVDPGTVYLYDRETEEIELLYRSRPDLPLESLATMIPISYTARDGLEIPGYLTLPKGVEPSNLPVVVNPHGGPWGRDRWGYRGYPQFLANRGYAVFQPNFRAFRGLRQSVLERRQQRVGHRRDATRY